MNCPQCNGPMVPYLILRTCEEVFGTGLSWEMARRTIKPEYLWSVKVTPAAKCSCGFKRVISRQTHAALCRLR